MNTLINPWTYKDWEQGLIDREVQCMNLKMKHACIPGLYTAGKIKDEDYEKYILSEDITYFPPIKKD